MAPAPAARRCGTAPPSWESSSWTSDTPVWLIGCCSDDVVVGEVAHERDRTSETGEVVDPRPGESGGDCRSHRADDQADEAGEEEARVHLSPPTSACRPWR